MAVLLAAGFTCWTLYLRSANRRASMPLEPAPEIPD
jgi:hypothetical protein